MMNQSAMDLQKAIVVTLARDISGGWERIVVNYEMQEEYGGLTENRLGFYISQDPKQALTENELEFSPELEELFRGLNDEMQRTGGTRWGTCDLVVDQPGKFRFSFSYDPPKRINGIHDDDSMGRFTHYLETYKAERAKSPR